jgi:hypothetical protein
MTDKIKYLLLATFVVAFVTYSFWGVLKEQFGIRVFYPGIALSFVGYTYVIHQLIKLMQCEKKKKRNLLIISNIIFLTTVNNLLDELFFNPTVISINEYMGFFVIIVVTIYNYYKDERNDTTGKKGLL